MYRFTFSEFDDFASLLASVRPSYGLGFKGAILDLVVK